MMEALADPLHAEVGALKRLARLVWPATVNVRSSRAAGRPATAMPAGRSPVGTPARSITARLEAYRSRQSMGCILRSI